MKKILLIAGLLYLCGCATSKPVAKESFPSATVPSSQNYIFNKPPMFASSTSGMGALCAGANNKDSDRFSPDNEFEYIKIHNPLNIKDPTQIIGTGGSLSVSTYDEASESWFKIDAYLSGTGLSFFRDSLDIKNKRNERCMLTLSHDLSALFKICTSEFDKKSAVNIHNIENLNKNLDLVLGNLKQIKSYVCAPKTQAVLDMHGVFLTEKERDVWDDLVEQFKKEAEIDLNEFSYPKIEQKNNCVKKPFIDTWETICPEDWKPQPDNNEKEGMYIAWKSLIQGPTKLYEKTGQIEFAYMWTWEYNSQGLFGYESMKSVQIRWHGQCTKNRARIAEAHIFSDIKAKNKIRVDVYEEPNWIPLDRSHSNWIVYELCDRQDLLNDLANDLGFN